MTQKSFFWNGTTTGDADTWTPAGGYHASVYEYQSPLIDLLFRALFNGTGNRGVLYGWGGDLAVSGVTSPVDVQAGAAILYGLFYENTAATTVAVPTPDSETRIDRIVVRRNWANKQARLTRLAGVEGGAAPALIQSPNTYYDIPLAQASIDIAGNITVTDEREFCAYSTAPIAGTLTATHVANEAVGLTARTTRTYRLFVPALEMKVPPRTLSYWSLFTTTPASEPSSQNAIYQSFLSVPFAYDGYTPPGYVPGYDASTRNIWLASTFRVPDNFADNSLDAYLWWSPYATASLSYYWRSTYQAWTPNGAVQYGGALSSYQESGTYVLDQIYRTQLKSITGLVGSEMIYYLLDWRNSSTDRPRAVGIEFVYTGYAP
jgi:hypothetical protein